MTTRSAAHPLPAVSIVIPMLNMQDYIADALRSILQERHVPIEVVVVDDGSTDRSRQVVASVDDPRVRVIDGPRRGISASLNAGLAEVRAPIVMRCDADDLYPRERIRRQVDWLTTHPEDDAVCGAFSTIDRTGQLVAKVAVRAGPESEQIDPELRRGVTRTHLCTFAIRRRVFDRIGNFREYFETAEDVDFQLRLGEQCQVRYLPVDEYFYRLHGESITHSRSSARRQFFDRIALDFQHQRQRTGSDSLMLGKPPAPPVAEQTPRGSVSMHLHHMLVGQSWRDLRDGRRRESVSRAWRAVVTHPVHLRGWTNFAKILYRAVFPR